MEKNNDIIWLERDMYMKNLVKFDGFSVDYIEIMPGAVEENVVHTQCDEWIYVLRGELLFMIDGEKVLMREGDYVNVPKNSIHGSVNETDQNVSILSVCNPPFELEFMAKIVKE